MEEMQDTWWDSSHYLYTTPQPQEKFLSFMNIEALKKSQHILQVTFMYLELWMCAIIVW